jgi:RND family efflux transporter MFP subunit
MLIGLLAGCHTQTEAVPPTPPARVTVALPLERETCNFEEASGRTEAVESVEIRSRVTGYLDKINFYDGAEVKQGDVLFEIDARPFIAARDQAAAQVNLRKADLEFRTAELERANKLINDNAISKSDFDQIVGAKAQAVAAVAAAEASERAAQLDVDFTKLIAPINGAVSRTKITRGNLVQADQTILTTIVSVDPMYVYFNIDERTILGLQERLRKGTIKAKKGELIPVWMELDDNEGFRHKGYVDFAENRFDWKTGTIQLRAVFENPKPETGARVLLPGLYAKVRIPVSEVYKAIMIAEIAICDQQGQKYVFVVNDKNKDKNEVEIRPVVLGKKEGRLRVIQEGLKMTDRVIVTGIQRVRPGAVVEPKVADMAIFALSDSPDSPAASTDVAAPKATVSESPETH